MKTKIKTTTKQVTSVLYTHEDLLVKLGLPPDAQLIITPPEDYDEGVMILDESSQLEAEYIVTNKNVTTKP